MIGSSNYLKKCLLFARRLDVFSPKKTDFSSSRLQIFFKIVAIKNVTSFTGKHLCWSLFLIKFKAYVVLQNVWRPLKAFIGLHKNFWGTTQTCNFIKKRLQQRSFPVKFVKFSRTPFFTEHLRWLFLLPLLLRLTPLSWKYDLGTSCFGKVSDFDGVILVNI